MYCVKCGKEIPNDSKFCPLCGAAVEESASVSQKTEAPKKKRKSAVRSQEDIKGERVADTIYLCQDGKYRWVYEMPMLKNPTILYTVWKVLGISFGAVFLLFQIINLFEDNFSVESLLSSLKVFGLLALAFLIISIIAYIIVAATYGWKYVVLFEMDEKQIKHIQISKQHDKAEILGLITALVGVAANKPTTAGIGLTAAARTSSTSEYAHVKSVKSFPRRHVIKISQGLDHNQVYAEGADYDFALEYIKSHCPKAKIAG
ncbi:MAG: zinc ribbon domain-containing protein [Clostridia bacterium]|nr:zinc ribbon domain-containing protein [Clostridia bacterium]